MDPFFKKKTQLLKNSAFFAFKIKPSLFCIFIAVNTVALSDQLGGIALLSNSNQM